MTRTIFIQHYDYHDHRKKFKKIDLFFFVIYNHNVSHKIRSGPSENKLTN